MKHIKERLGNYDMCLLDIIIQSQARAYLFDMYVCSLH